MPRSGWSPPWDAWDLEQDIRLRELAGRMPAAEIAAALSAQFAIPRTRTAVLSRAKRLGISVARSGYSLRGVEVVCGVDHRTILSWWVRHGLLQPTRRWPRMGPYEGWLFTTAELERFLRAHPYAYDVSRMALGRLRSLGQVAQRADPWLTRDQAARALGYASGESLSRWLARGVVPHVRRPNAGPYDQVFVRARDLGVIGETIRSLVAENEARKRRRAVGLRLHRRDARAA